MSIEEELYEAIEYIADGKYKKYLSQTDKITQGTITTCTNYVYGKYKVKIDNNYVDAYSLNTDSIFSNGANVLVIYCADIDKRIILGSSSKEGKPTDIDIDTDILDSQYNLYGINIITECGNLGLSSYHDRQIITLYKKDVTENIIKLDINALEKNIKNADHLCIGGYFRNELPREQQQAGNFGIVVSATFKTSKDSTELETREFILDINKFIGQPYKLINFTKQSFYFPIDGENFVSIDEIYAFCMDFSHIDMTKPSDIFIKDLFIQNASLITNLLSDRVSIEGNNIFSTESGIVDNKIALKANLFIKGQKVENYTEDTTFYWFIEDASIDNFSDDYDLHGGKGWRCFKEPFPPGVKIKENQFSISEVLCPAPETKIKCVVEYSSMLVTSPIVILYNPNSTVSIEIASTNGTIFHAGNGITDLKCNVVASSFPSDALSYKWTEEWVDGTIRNLQETGELNKTVARLLGEYAQHKAAFETARADADLIALEQIIKNDEEELSKYIAYYAKPGNKIAFRVQGDYLHNIYPSDIFRKVTYKCAVYGGNVYLGTGSIDLVNTLIDENQGYMRIKNGDKAFKFNKEGLSPGAAAFNNNQLEELDVLLYDSTGLLISDNPKNIIDTVWQIPKNNTFITVVPEMEQELVDDPELDYYTLKGRPLKFKLASMYKASYTNNIIKVIATYNGITYNAYTSFVFIKEGDIGTNGTDYVCRILPNTDDVNPPLYPVITTMSDGQIDLINLDFADAGFPEYETSIPKTETGRDIYIVSWESPTKAIAVGPFDTQKIEKSFAIINLPDKDGIERPTFASLDHTYDPDIDFYKDDSISRLNYNVKGSSQGNQYSNEVEWLKVEVWKDGEVVFDSSIDSYEKGKVKWRIQRPRVKALKSSGEIAEDVSGYSNFSYIDGTTENGIYTENGCKFNYNPNKAELLSTNYIADSGIEGVSDFDVNNPMNSPHNIIECIVTMDGKEYYATMPIITINQCYNVYGNHKVEYDFDSGYHAVRYNNSGLNPIYSMDKPFTFTIKTPYGKDGGIDYIDVSENQNVKIHYGISGGTYRVYKVDENTNSIKFVYDELLKQNKIYKEVEKINKETDEIIKEQVLIKNQINLEPKSEFLGDQMNTALRIDVMLDFPEGAILNRRIGSAHIPIDMYIDRYANQAINGWDGNSVSVDSDGSGMILAPQIGAGKKEADNSFTGMVMGTVRDVGEINDKVGLFGYSKGERTSFISAKDGHAAFGRKGSGQILIDPREFIDPITGTKRPGHAVLFSRDFWKSYDSDTELPNTQYIWDKDNQCYDGQNTDSDNFSLAIDLTDGRIVSANGRLIIDSENGIIIKNSKGINIVE